MKFSNKAIFLTLMLLILPTLATADCLITADISAESTDNPLGAYQYTMNFTWDMDSQYGLSHFNLLLDAAGGTCECGDFSSTISFASTVGSSSGDGDCSVDYIAILECSGDPTIPDTDGILFKFEPVESACEPGNTGTGSIIFYSNLAPVNVNEEIIGMTDKGAHTYCYGSISGVFPGMACDPVAVNSLPWGSVKSIYQ